MADCVELSYATFHDWFEPGFVAILYTTGQNYLNELAAYIINI